MLSDLLRLPLMREMDVDSEQRVHVHRQILLEKKLTREVFFEFYRVLLDAEARCFDRASGLRFEIGAGTSLMAELDPGVISTDVVPGPFISQVVDAMAMPFADGEVKSIFAINCFHHFPDPYKFFEEVERVCAPGGGALIIDPYYGPLAGMLYKRLFPDETFDRSGPAVKDAGGQGPMSDANQALSYIVFKRERTMLDRRFPNLEIVEGAPLSNYIRYLASGGINFRQLVPDFATPALKLLEAGLTPIQTLFALHHYIVVRRRDGA